MSDRITYCDVVECCEECPKYGDDCDGDKRNDDLISRADAIEAVCGVVIDEFDVSPTKGYEVSEKALSALPSAEPSLKAIKRKIDEHWYLDAPSAETVSVEDAMQIRNTILFKEYMRGRRDAVQGWIPCYERLPSEDGHYLCCNNGYLPYVGYFRNGRWSDFDCTIVHADAWMPLPTPYKGGDTE